MTKHAGGPCAGGGRGGCNERSPTPSTAARTVPFCRSQSNSVVDPFVKSHMLFGNILGVSWSDLQLIVAVTGIILLALALFHKELELTSFDRTHAEVIGLRADYLKYLLLVLLALAVVTGIQAVGVILTSALLVTPAATASLLSNRFSHVMGIAALIAVVSAIVGLYVSYYGQASSGAAIVLTCTGFFGVAWLGHATKQRFAPATQKCDAAE